jgi:hypothetical protein
MQIASISFSDMMPVEQAPIRPGVRLGPCLLVINGRFRLGGWDGECWHDEDFAIVRPTRWLLLTDSAAC